MTALILLGLVVVGCSLLVSCVRALQVTSDERREQWAGERATVEPEWPPPCDACEVAEHDCPGRILRETCASIRAALEREDLERRRRGLE